MMDIKGNEFLSVEHIFAAGARGVDAQCCLCHHRWRTPVAMFHPSRRDLAERLIECPACHTNLVGVAGESPMARAIEISGVPDAGREA